MSTSISAGVGFLPTFFLWSLIELKIPYICNYKNLVVKAAWVNWWHGCSVNV